MTAPSPPGRTAAVVVAAGQGLRLEAGVPKALAMLGGAPLFMWAVVALLDARSVDLIVVAAPVDQVEGMQVSCGRAALVVAGGATRQHSVRNALAALPDDVDVVLVHDAARALAPVALIDSVVAAVRAGADAVIPALPVVDTIKRVAPAGSVKGHEVVLETVDRGSLRAVQTPQGFRRAALIDAHERCGDAVTDDAAVIEAVGGVVVVVPGSPEAFKITAPLDLLLAQALVAHRERQIMDSTDGTDAR